MRRFGIGLLVIGFTLLIASKSASAQQFRSEGYCGSVAVYSQDISYLGVEVVRGYMLDSRNFAGMGVGVCSFLGDLYLSSSVFATFRHYLSEKDNSLFFGGKTGYNSRFYDMKVMFEGELGWIWTGNGRSGYSIALIFPANNKSDLPVYLPKLSFAVHF